MSQKEAIRKIKAYLQILIQEGIPVERAYLYGSYAKNLASEESDIDVMLISEFFDTTDDFVLSKPWLFTTKVDHRIEPVAIGTKRFLTDDSSPLIEIVRLEGIEVVP